MKTIFYGDKPDHRGNRQRTALVELDDDELGQFGCSRYSDEHFRRDPAEALAEVVKRDRRAAAKLINESSPMHVVGAALAKLEEYLKAAPKITGLEIVDPASEAIKDSVSG